MFLYSIPVIITNGDDDYVDMLLSQAAEFVVL